MKLFTCSLPTQANQLAQNSLPKSAQLIKLMLTTTWRHPNDPFDYDLPAGTCGVARPRPTHRGALRYKLFTS